MKTYFYKSQFTDCVGKVHHVTVAGVVRKCHTMSYVETADTKAWAEGIMYGDTELEKFLSIGVSIQNPEDEYNERVGELQAEGRALKPRRPEQIRELYVTKYGMLNERLVEAILQNVAEAVALNPESFIPGYLKMEKRWKGNQQ